MQAMKIKAALWAAAIVAAFLAGFAIACVISAFNPQPIADDPAPVLDVNDPPAEAHECYIPEDMREGL